MPGAQAGAYALPPAENGFVLAGWLVFAAAWITLFALIAAEASAESCRLLGLFVLASMVMVGVDGSRNKISVLKRSALPLSSLERSSTASWVVGTWLLWLIFFPLYLAKRNRIVSAARETIAHNRYRA